MDTINSKTQHTDDLTPRFEILGKLATLWMHSPLQRSWPASCAAEFLLPPLLLGQYELVVRDGAPVAYCSWAWLTEEQEIRYLLNPSTLPAQAWSAGDRLWFVDWVAPFDARDSRRLMRAVQKRFPNDVGRSIHVKPGQQTAHVREFRGPAVPVAEAERRLAVYHDSLRRQLQAVNGKVHEGRSISVRQKEAR